MAKSNDAGNEKTCAVLSYLLIGIIWYFADEKMKKSSAVKYHVKQGLVLLIAWVIYSIIISILLWPLVLMSFGAFYPLIQLFNLVPWIFVILGIINAANGKQKELPIIGKFAKNFTF